MDKKTQNSDTGDIKKQKPYFDKNRLFGVWIPSSLYEWFQQYLEKYSYGKMPPDRFIVHAYINTKELLEKGYGLARAQCL